MALRQYTVTLTTAALQAITTNLPITFLRIENEIGNAAVKYGTSAISATDYAGEVLADTATISNGVSIGPFDTPGRMNLQEFWFLGTNTQKIHLTVITS